MTLHEERRRRDAYGQVWRQVGEAVAAAEGSPAEADLRRLLRGRRSRRGAVVPGGLFAGGFRGGFGAPRVSPRSYGGGSFWPFMAGYGMGGAVPGAPGGSGGDLSGSGCGCASIIVAALAAVTSWRFSGTVATRLTSCTSTAMSADISASTVDREALPAGALPPSSLSIIAMKMGLDL